MHPSRNSMRSSTSIRLMLLIYVGIQSLNIKDVSGFVLTKNIEHSRLNINHVYKEQFHPIRNTLPRYIRINTRTNNATSEGLCMILPTMSSSAETINTISLQKEEAQLACWIFAFSASHIGMSAIREKLIQGCGQFAKSLNLIDSGLELPRWWPGDDVGKNKVLPDVETAGRQLYRILYTAVSIVTLGSALAVYLHLNNAFHDGLVEESDVKRFFSTTTDKERMAYFFVASTSFAASIASLFNASPLSLMPGFQAASDNGYKSETAALAGLLERNDALKFLPRGLTRITRHPLILPVVPWGISTSILLGGRLPDFILFCGLSLYAVAGCFCQDLRITRKEGSVGTVFRPSETIIRQDSVQDTIGGEIRKLDSFYSETSFIPFAAVLDGRQSLATIARDFPIIPFLAGIPIGGYIEDQLLHALAR